MKKSKQEESAPRVGQTIGGVELLEVLGEGPTGTVYRGQTGTGPVAVKVLHRDQAGPEAVETVWSDLQCLALLGGGGFIRMIESGTTPGGYAWFVEELLDGSDLSSALGACGAMAPHRALEVFRQIADAVSRAHAAGVVHGALKPRNVFLRPTSPGDIEVCVLDFGAGVLGGGGSSGVVAGDPRYMAPEQFASAPSFSTDVYTLGVLLYELVFGRPPFAGSSQGQIMMRQLSEAPSFPSGTEESLTALLRRALAKRPEDRFATVEELWGAVARWADTSPLFLDPYVAPLSMMGRRSQETSAMSQPTQSADGSIEPSRKKPPAVPTIVANAASDRGRRGGKGKGAASEAKPDADRPPPAPAKSNAPESVEASLEEFISQANASFPVQDGWDLHTGDVELIEDAAETFVESDTPAAAPAQTETHVPTAKIAQAAAPVAGIADQLEPAAATGPRQSPAATAQLPAQPAQQGVSMKMFIAAIFGVFVLAMVGVFFIVKLAMPQPQPAPVIIQAPAPAAAPTAPVVTGLPTASPVAGEPAQPSAAPEATGATAQPSAAPAEQPTGASPAAAAAEQPTVTPITTPITTTAQPAAPASPTAEPAAAATPSPSAASPESATAAAPSPAKKTSRHRSSATSATKPASAEPKASAPKKEPAKKEAPKKTGGDWVDPF